MSFNSATVFANQSDFKTLQHKGKFCQKKSFFITKLTHTKSHLSEPFSEAFYIVYTDILLKYYSEDKTM